MAFLDSDDEWTRDRLLLGRRLLAARPDVLFCFSDFGLRHSGSRTREAASPGGMATRGPGTRSSRPASGTRRSPSFLRSAPISVHLGSLYALLLQGPYVPVQTLLVRREAAGSDFRFAEDLPTYEDWECIARLARAGNGAYLDVVTARQWGHDSPRVTDTDQFERTTARVEMIERIWGTDAAYLARDANRVARVLRDQRLRQARYLLRRGRRREARTVLRLSPKLRLRTDCLQGCLVH